MVDFEIEVLRDPPQGRRGVEVVERKGRGHPDTICDSIAEAVSVALCAEYLRRAGRVLHYNADKALLVAGASSPALGGGVIDAPLRLVLGDRATNEWAGERIPVDELAEAAARRWIAAHLRYVDAARDVVFESTLRPGSAALAGLYDGAVTGANDTSVGVGHAPYTETEEAVLAAERHLVSPAVQARHPYAGEDVKVMAVRRGRRLELTVAVAMVGRFLPDVDAYLAAKNALRGEVVAELAPALKGVDELEVIVNALDEPARGGDGLYLTVSGTSAEGADGGEVGRGNRVDGLISFGRPCSLEAAAGKNATGHVGKIYNVLAHGAAGAIHARVPGLEEVRVLLASRIGRPLGDPWVASAQVVPADGVGRSDVEAGIREVFAGELAKLDEVVAALVRGERDVC